MHGIDYKQARFFSERLGEETHQLVKEISTVTVSTNQRGNKVFIDPSQNDYADTLASAYSARPCLLPTVSTPLEWKEVKPGLNPLNFIIETIIKRLEKKGDMFAGVLDEKVARANTMLLQKL